jgi:hypothetical protein
MKYGENALEITVVARTLVVNGINGVITFKMMRMVME